MPEEQFFSALQEENWPLVNRIEVSEKDVRKIHRLGTGAAFYLGRLCEKSGKSDIAERFYRQEYEKGTGIWRVQAGHRLLRLLLEEERFEDAETQALDMLKTVLEIKEALRGLIEARYQMEKYQAVIDTIAKLREIKGTEESEDGELALVQAVALHETGGFGWEDDIREIFTEFPASEVHFRLYLYLRHNRLLASSFTDLEQKVFLWKYLIGAEDFIGGAEIIEKAIQDSSMTSLLSSRVNVKDLETTFRKSGYVLEGAEALKKILPGKAESRNPPVYLLHAIGRLLMAGGDLAGAEKYFEKGMAGSRTKAEYDRELWYLLYAVYRQSPGKVPRLLVRYAKTWNNPAYFADILEDVGAYLVRNGQWRELEELEEKIGGTMDPLTVHRFSFITAMARIYGYLDNPAERGETPVWTVAETQSYYALLKEIKLPELDRIDTGAAIVNEMSLVEEFVLGHLTYGLYTEAAEEAERHFDALSPVVLKRIVTRLSERGYYREGILLLRDIEKQYPLEIDRSAMLSFNPRGFRNIVAETAGREGIPEHLLNALIRVESAFDKNISSHAGAVGLTQLMPATAGETAGKMGMEEIDLTDPDFSISVGARYFSDMHKRFGSYMYALFAYNAGPGRMRSWLKSFGHLPPILFLEAIPFRETREYGRKVLVTTAHYQYLYENRPIRESVELFFPDLY